MALAITNAAKDLLNRINTAARNVGLGTILQSIGAAVDTLQAQVAVLNPEVPQVVTDATTARTFGLTDADKVGDRKYIRFTSGSAVSATVPTNASVAIPIGSQIVSRQAGAGLLTIVAAGGVTINAPAGGSLVSAGQGSTLILTKVAANEWDLAGPTAAP